MSRPAVKGLPDAFIVGFDSRGYTVNKIEPKRYIKIPGVASKPIIQANRMLRAVCEGMGKDTTPGRGT